MEEFNGLGGVERCKHRLVARVLGLDRQTFLYSSTLIGANIKGFSSKDNRTESRVIEMLGSEIWIEGIQSFLLFCLPIKSAKHDRNNCS